MVFLKKGSPFPFTTLMAPDAVHSPTTLDMVISLPSRCFSWKLNPRSACFKVMSFSMTRSAPCLLKSLCFFTPIFTITSPASAPGISFPSQLNFTIWSVGVPGSTESSSFLETSVTFFPLQPLQTFLGSMIYSVSLSYLSLALTFPAGGLRLGVHSWT